MSLDIYLERPNACPKCGHQLGEEPVELFHANITHNVHPMWTRAGCGDALYESQGKKAAEILPDVERGLTAMRTDPAAYRALNPSNGWGDYDGAVEWLARFVDACRAHPEAVVRVWR